MFQRGVAPVFGMVVMAMLFAVAPHAVQAQSTAPAAKPATSPAAKPAKPAAAPVVQYGDPAERNAYWSVNTALPSQYSEPTRTPAKPSADRSRSATGPGDNTRPLGRVPLRDAPGSIGFTAGQSARSGRFEDGREVPGLNPNTQQESSYVGLSLSVTSTNKRFPVPIPSFGRPE
jgi:hypothetical protein